MVIKTEKGFIAIPSKKVKEQKKSIQVIALELSKKLHKTDNFHILKI